MRLQHIPVGSGTNLVDDSRLQVDIHGTRHVLTSASFREKRVEGVVSSSHAFIGRHLAVWLDAVLEAIQLPARISDLHSGLADVNRDALTHDVESALKKKLLNNVLKQCEKSKTSENKEPRLQINVLYLQKIGHSCVYACIH